MPRAGNGLDARPPNFHSPPGRKEVSMFSKRAAWFGAAALAGLAVPVLGQTVNDSGFEEINLTDNFQYNPSGAYVGNAGVTDPPSGFSNVASPEGTQYAFVQQGNGTLGAGGSYVNRNVFGLTEGQQYLVTFAAAGRGGAGPNPINVVVNGSTIG